MNKLKGFVNGIISSATFGMIPLFSLPVLGAGMMFTSVLSYRFLFATVFLAITLLIKKEDFRIEWRELGPLTLLAVFYIVSSVFLMWGYEYMSSGVATTIHFMYPVITTVIMMVFFHEKKSFWRIMAVIMAIVGVGFLSHTGTGAKLSAVGIIIVLTSSIGYALYLVAIGQMKSLKIKGMKLTFYVFLLSTIILWAGMLIFGKIQPIENGNMLINLLLLALIPTVVSNLTLVEAIKNIGSTLTSVLGAMEPVTAVLLGIAVFSEPFTLTIAIGIVLIVSAVSIIIVKK